MHCSSLNWKVATAPIHDTILTLSNSPSSIEIVFFISASEGFSVYWIGEYHRSVWTSSNALEELFLVLKTRAQGWWWSATSLRHSPRLSLMCQLLSSILSVFMWGFYCFHFPSCSSAVSYLTCQTAAKERECLYQSAEQIVFLRAIRSNSHATNVQFSFQSWKLNMSRMIFYLMPRSTITIGSVL